MAIAVNPPESRVKIVDHVSPSTVFTRAFPATAPPSAGFFRLPVISATRATDGSVTMGTSNPDTSAGSVSVADASPGDTYGMGCVSSWMPQLPDEYTVDAFTESTPTKLPSQSREGYHVRL